MADVDFKQILDDAGLPTTEAQLQAQWEAELVAQGNPISNSSQWSPFRKLIDAMVVTPALQIIESIINTTLPNQFLVTSSGEMLELKGQELNVTKEPAKVAKGLLTLFRDDASVSLSIDAGKIVQTPLINGVRYQLVITQDAVFLPGISTVLVTAEAVQAGAIYNLPDNYYNTFAEPIDGVSVTNAENWLTTPGQNEETEEDFKQRCINQFNLVGEYHTDAVYRGMIVDKFDIRTEDVYFEHDAPRGPGTANGFILLPVGTASTQQLAAINQYITDQGNHGHGDDLIIYAMPETNHDISVDIWSKATLTAAEETVLLANVENFVRAAFRENLLYTPTTTHPLSVFSFSRLSQELHDTFSDIERLVFTNSDITNGLNIARINTLTVNHNG
jgi:hypothetical protein